MVRTALRIAFALPLVAGVLFAHADELEGTVLAFDRVAQVLVMKDKRVFPLETLERELPADLVAGDRVQVSFESNEDLGVYLVHSVTRLD